MVERNGNYTMTFFFPVAAAMNAQVDNQTIIKFSLRAVVFSSGYVTKLNQVKSQTPSHFFSHVKIGRQEDNLVCLDIKTEVLSHVLIYGHS